VDCSIRGLPLWHLFVDRPLGTFVDCPHGQPLSCFALVAHRGYLIVSPPSRATYRVYRHHSFNRPLMSGPKYGTWLLTSSPPTQARSRDGRHQLFCGYFCGRRRFRSLGGASSILLFAFSNRVVADARLLAWTSSTSCWPGRKRETSAVWCFRRSTLRLAYSLHL